MATVNVSNDIPAPQEKVWAVFADPSRRPEWLTIHDGWKSEPPTSVEQGSTFTEMCTVMGMTNKIDWTVDRYDAPNSLTISGSGLAGARISFVLSVEGGADASTATIDAEFTGAMVVGAIGAAIERSARTEVEKSLAALAELVG